MQQIADGIFYIGVNDHQLDLFEGQYIVPNGMAYNSYVLMDEKVAVMDTSDARTLDLWKQNLVEALGGPDGYLPSDGSSDGVHLSAGKYLEWCDYLRTHYVPTEETEAIFAAAAAAEEAAAAEGAEVAVEGAEG